MYDLRSESRGVPAGFRGCPDGLEVRCGRNTLISKGKSRKDRPDNCIGRKQKRWRNTVISGEITRTPRSPRPAPVPFPRICLGRDSVALSRAGRPVDTTRRGAGCATSKPGGVRGDDWPNEANPCGCPEGLAGGRSQSAGRCKSAVRPVDRYGQRRAVDEGRRRGVETAVRGEPEIELDRRISEEPRATVPVGTGRIGNHVVQRQGSDPLHRSGASRKGVHLRSLAGSEPARRPCFRLPSFPI